MIQIHSVGQKQYLDHNKNVWAWSSEDDNFINHKNICQIRIWLETADLVTTDFDITLWQRIRTLDKLEAKSGVKTAQITDHDDLKSTTITEWLTYIIFYLLLFYHQDLTFRAYNICVLHNESTQDLLIITSKHAQKYKM